MMVETYGERQREMRKSGWPKLNLRDMCVEVAINGALYKRNRCRHQPHSRFWVPVATLLIFIPKILRAPSSDHFKTMYSNPKLCHEPDNRSWKISCEMTFLTNMENVNYHHKPRNSWWTLWTHDRWSRGSRLNSIFARLLTLWNFQ